VFSFTLRPLNGKVKDLLLPFVEEIGYNGEEESPVPISNRIPFLVFCISHYSINELMFMNYPS
jgi:hypothetical protein